MLAGPQLVVGGTIMAVLRPILMLLGVDWTEDEDTNNNSSINPDTVTIKVRHMQMHMQIINNTGEADVWIISRGMFLHLRR